MTFTFPPFAITTALLILVVTAAIYDIRTRRIPNWLSAAGIILALALNAFLQPTWTGLRFSLLGLVFSFAVYIVLYALRAMGAGDVKLMAAVGAMVGWQNWIAIFFITAFIGGAAALLLIALRGRVRKTLWNVAFIFSEMKSGRPAYLKNEELDVRSSKALALPHAPVIAAGCIVFLWWSKLQLAS